MHTVMSSIVRRSKVIYWASFGALLAVGFFETAPDADAMLKALVAMLAGVASCLLDGKGNWPPKQEGA